jgi:hypothetical protein
VVRANLRFTGFLCIHSDDLNLVGVKARGVVELEVDVLDDEGPHFVTEAVGIEVALYMPLAYYDLVDFAESMCTLKLNLAFTFSANTSATTRSNVASTFSATCGSIWPLVMKASSASVSAVPMLVLLAKAEFSAASSCA